MQNKSTRRGFTLIELLIVVLIIGILAAIALPQYQKAVMKSRFSALMPIAKNIANGNEVYYMEHGNYSANPAELMVQGKAEYPDGTELDMSTGEYSFVLAGRDNNFPMNYIVYQKHSGKFADNIHCEANENNNIAKEICQSLGGQLINGSQTDGFLTYVLSGTVGENDKFPTSIAKLKAQICVNISEENCIVDEQKGTITTHECGGNVSYNNNGTSSTGAGCVNTVYGSDGTPAGQAATICKTNKATYDFTTGSCTPKTNSGTLSSVYNPNQAYEIIYDQNGNITEQKFCTHYDSSYGGCYGSWQYKYDTTNGSYSKMYRLCTTGPINSSTMACENGYRSGSVYGYTYDSNNNRTEEIRCNSSTVSTTDGSCADYTYHTKYEYFKDKEGVTRYTSIHCSSFTGTECTGGWTYWGSNCPNGYNQTTQTCN